MTEKLKVQGSKFKGILLGLVLLTACCLLYSPAEAKVYIDITSPGLKKLPIAVQNFEGGKDISDIIQDDLTYTGLFICIEDAAQIERPEDRFNSANWKGLGVELVVKGRVEKSGTVTVSAFDVAEGKEIIRKEYSASKELIRPLAHTIANDIYKTLTGKPGIFRTKLSFVAERNSTKELHLMDWDGHRPYGAGISAGILLAPRWATDGSKLIYSAERQRQWGIYVLDMNTMRERIIVTLKGLNMTGNFYPDNKEFIFASSKDGTLDIYVGDIVTVKGRKLISSPWIDVSPAVSPDGKNILFVSNRSGSPQIYMADKDGYGIRRLTFQGSYNTAPTWSPKGDRLAFSGMVSGRHQIFIMKPDGSGLTQLTDHGNNEEPSFSPDERYITFVSDRDGIKGVYIMRADGEAQKRVSPRGMRATSPGWSPQ